MFRGVYGILRPSRRTTYSGEQLNSGAIQFLAQLEAEARYRYLLTLGNASAFSSTLRSTVSEPIYKR